MKGYDVGVFFMSKNSTRISSTIKVAKKRSRGRPQEQHSNFNFWGVDVYGGVGEIKWCRGNWHKMGIV